MWSYMSESSASKDMIFFFYNDNMRIPSYLLTLIVKNIEN